jgi:putative transposase
MIRSQKLLLSPTVKQEKLLFGAIGLRRFAWNWALAICKRHYRMFKGKTGYKRITAFTIKKHWNKIKDRKYPWTREYSKLVAEEAFHSLEKAYQAAFSRYSKLKKIGKGKWWKKVGWPTFKKKRISSGSFNVIPAKQFPLIVKNGRIRIPRVGLVKLVTKLRFPIAPHVYGIVKLICGKWHLTLSQEVPDKAKLPDDRPTCGVDLGCKTFATVVSGGELREQVEPLKPYAKTKRKLKRLQRAVSRKFKKGKKQSKRYRRSQSKVAKCHELIADLRSNFLNQLTARLVKEYGVIVLEDLSVSGMMKGWLSGTVADMGFGTFRRMIEYKAAEVGTRVVIANRYYPSSKTCFQCGNVKKELSLSEREYRCECGYCADRDVNAARNLETIPVAYRELTGVESGSSSSSLEA